MYAIPIVIYLRTFVSIYSLIKTDKIKMQKECCLSIWRRERSNINNQCSMYYSNTQTERIPSDNKYLKAPKCWPSMINEWMIRLLVSNIVRLFIPENHETSIYLVGSQSRAGVFFALYTAEGKWTWTVHNILNSNQFCSVFNFMYSWLSCQFTDRWVVVDMDTDSVSKIMIRNNLAPVTHIIY